MEEFDFINLWRLTSYLPMGENSIASGMFRWNVEVFLGLMGIGWVSFFVLSTIQKQRLAPHSAPLFKTLFVVGVFGLCFTLGTQWVGRFTYDHLRPDGEPQTSSQKGRNPEKHRPARTSRGNGYAFLILIVLMIIGGGYAYTAMHDLGLVAHFFAFTFGVGLTVELGKLIAAAIIASPGLGLLKNRATMLPFLIAGLGFGLAEAFLYLGDYSMGQASGIEHYLRGTWSVLLHTAWAAITGYMVLRSESEIPEVGQVLDVSDTFWSLIFVMLPTALLHGLYDALCAHNEPIYALLVGLVSLSLGWLACQRYKIKT
jgi:RsiW-degrading membrane proteinase PrsW (M82 family)